MTGTTSVIGFGGSCHWCTEAIFLSLRGVESVEQDWIATEDQGEGFSEAVMVRFNSDKIALPTLIAVHLSTHSCTSSHGLRAKYRSAVYTFTDEQMGQAQASIDNLQLQYDEAIITRVLPYKEFRLNKEQYLNYYYSDPERPFCRNIIDPKLRALLREYSEVVDMGKLAHLSLR